MDTLIAKLYSTYWGHLLKTGEIILFFASVVLASYIIAYIPTKILEIISRYWYVSDIEKYINKGEKGDVDNVIITGDKFKWEWLNPNHIYILYILIMTVLIGVSIFSGMYEAGLSSILVFGLFGFFTIVITFCWNTFIIPIVSWSKISVYHMYNIGEKVTVGIGGTKYRGIVFDYNVKELSMILLDDQGKLPEEGPLIKLELDIVKAASPDYRLRSFIPDYNLYLMMKRRLEIEKTVAWKCKFAETPPNSDGSELIFNNVQNSLVKTATFEAMQGNTAFGSKAVTSRSYNDVESGSGDTMDPLRYYRYYLGHKAIDAELENKKYRHLYEKRKGL